MGNGSQPFVGALLHPDILQQVRQHSYHGVRRGNELTRFALGCMKILFTDHERLRDCNVNGSNGKAPLSPTGRRICAILNATAQEFGTSVDTIEVLVKKAIDASNRKLRFQNRRFNENQY